MGQIMDGAWVHENRSSVFDADPNKITHPTWKPHSCEARSYEPADLQQAFKGRHFHFVGDSTVEELMDIVMQALWPEHDPTNGPLPKHKFAHRTYDSLDAYTTRFSFNWAGGSDAYDNWKGLPSIVANSSRFVKTIRPDVDFIVFGAGIHDLAGGVPLFQYHAALRDIVAILLRSAPIVNAERTRFILRTVNPLNRPCNGWQGGNAQIHSMNFLAYQVAREYNLTFMDSNTAFRAEDTYLKRLGSPHCDDSIHCAKWGGQRHCPKCVVQASAILQFLRENFVLSEDSGDAHHHAP